MVRTTLHVMKVGWGRVKTSLHVMMGFEEELIPLHVKMGVGDGLEPCYM